MTRKPGFIFFFADEPQFAAPESRAYVAHMLRAWRSKAQCPNGRYIVTRIEPGRYSATLRYPGAPTAIVQRFA